MERQLSTGRWLVGDRCTIADIALFAYTQVADQGGFSLGCYPAIRPWIDRIAAHPRHFRMS